MSTNKQSVKLSRAAEEAEQRKESGESKMDSLKERSKGKIQDLDLLIRRLL